MQCYVRPQSGFHQRFAWVRTLVSTCPRAQTQPAQGNYQQRRHRKQETSTAVFRGEPWPWQMGMWHMERNMWRAWVGGNAALALTCKTQINHLLLWEEWNWKYYPKFFPAGSFLSFFFFFFLKFSTVQSKGTLGCGEKMISPKKAYLKLGANSKQSCD